MNFPMLNVGIDYQINSIPVQFRSKIKTTDESVDFYAGVFFKTRTSNDQGNIKLMLGIQAGFYKPFTLTNAAGVAVEASCDAALKERYRQNGELYDHRIISGLIRHHFLFVNFDFSQAIGIYLRNKQPNPNYIFKRYALEHKIARHLKIGFSLKAHLQVANQMDLRMTAVL